MNQSSDRGSFQPFVPCDCAKCEPIHGDQAESSEVLELYRLRDENRLLREQVRMLEARLGTGRTGGEANTWP